MNDSKKTGGLQKGELARLRRENETLRAIVIEFHWQARRYVDGRCTGAPGMFNQHVQTLLALGVPLNPTGDDTIWARSGRFGLDSGAEAAADVRDMTEERLEPGHPVARGDTQGGIPDSFQQARTLWTGIQKVSADPNKYRPLLDASKARLEEQIKNGPSGPVGDDAPDNMDWVPAWQEEKRLWWGVLFLMLAGEGLEAEWEKRIARYYFETPTGSGMTSTTYCLPFAEGVLTEREARQVAAAKTTQALETAQTFGIFDAELNTTEPFWVRFFMMDGVLHMEAKNGTKSLTRNGLCEPTAAALRWQELARSGADTTSDDLHDLIGEEGQPNTFRPATDEEKTLQTEFEALNAKYGFIGVACDVDSFERGDYSG